MKIKFALLLKKIDVFLITKPDNSLVQRALPHKSPNKCIGSLKTVDA